MGQAAAQALDVAKPEAEMTSPKAIRSDASASFADSMAPRAGTPFQGSILILLDSAPVQALRSDIMRRVCNRTIADGSEG
jgi:hypothetical protein